MYSLLNELNDWYLSHEDPWTIDQSLIDIFRLYEYRDLKDLRMWFDGGCEGEGPYTDWMREILTGYFGTYLE